MRVVGITAAVATPKAVLTKLGVEGDELPYSTDEVKFGGVLEFLDLEDRTKEMSLMGVGRMWWACKTLDESHEFIILLGDSMVRGEFPSSGVWQPAVLRRVDVDVAVDVVCLSIYWHNPQNNKDFLT